MSCPNQGESQQTLIGQRPADRILLRRLPRGPKNDLRISAIWGTQDRCSAQGSQSCEEHQTIQISERGKMSEVLSPSNELDQIRHEMRRDRKDLRRQLRHQRQFLTIIATVFGLFAAGIGAFVGFIHSVDRDELVRNFERERTERERFATFERTQRENFETELRQRIEGKGRTSLLFFWK